MRCCPEKKLVRILRLASTKLSTPSIVESNSKGNRNCSKGSESTCVLGKPCVKSNLEDLTQAKSDESEWAKICDSLTTVYIPPLGPIPTLYFHTCTPKTHDLSARRSIPLPPSFG